MSRAKSLRLIRQIRAIGRCEQTQNAVIKSTYEQIKRKLPGKPFLIQKRKMAELNAKKKFIPTRLNYFNLLLRKAYMRTFNRKKLKLSESIFGTNGKFGLLVVRPELFGHLQSVKQQLQMRGLSVELSKVFSFDKTTFLEVYPQARKYANQFPEFTPFAANMINGLSRVIVFKWDKNKSISEREKLLNEMKQNMRKTIALPFLKQLGFTRGELGLIAKDLDALGFAEATNANESSLLNMFNGVHMPNINDMVKDSIVFLTTKELIKLSQI